MTRKPFALLLLVAMVASCGSETAITTPEERATPGPQLAIGTDPVTGATIETDLDDYYPGQVVHLTGAGWAANETISLVMTEDPDTHADVTQEVVAGADGKFSLDFYEVQTSDLGVTFTLTATGPTSGSVVTVIFTDGIFQIGIFSDPVGVFSTIDYKVRNGCGLSSGSTGVLTHTVGGTRIAVNATKVLIFKVPSPGGYTFQGHSAPGLTVTAVADSLCIGGGSPAGADAAKDVTLNYTTVVSNTAPTLDPIGNKEVDEGSLITFTANADDSDTPAQTLTFSLVGAPAGATIHATTGVFSWTPTDGPAQTATFTVKVTDNGSPSMSDEEEITITVKNVAPTATFGNDGPVDEGSAFTLSLTGATDVSSNDVTSGFTFAFNCGNGYGAFGASTTASCPTTDNGTPSVGGKVKDKDGGEREYSGTVTVENVAPSITGITLPSGPVPVGSNVSVSWAFDDPGSDTWQCKISWDQPVAYGALFNSTGKTCTASSNTLPAGVYTVTVYVKDDDGGEDTETATAYIVVYDPNGGFVTGGGWINSPAGAYIADTYLTGKATFGFVSKYEKGKNYPTGNTEFQFHAGDLNFKSTSYDWLVVAGTLAQYKGVGTINGAGDYGFLLTAKDGSPDKFRIKIWAIGGAVVYDNALGAAEDSDASTALGGGSIVIHTKK